MAKLNWEKAASQARFDQFKRVGKTDKIRKHQTKSDKTKSSKLLASSICDCLENGIVTKDDYPVLLSAADRLSQGRTMTPKQSGSWSKYAKAAKSIRYHQPMP